MMKSVFVHVFIVVDLVEGEVSAECLFDVGGNEAVVEEAVDVAFVEFEESRDTRNSVLEFISGYGDDIFDGNRLVAVLFLNRPAENCQSFCLFFRHVGGVLF